jgi:hypothetical protein
MISLGHSPNTKYSHLWHPSSEVGTISCGNSGRKSISEPAKLNRDDELIGVDVSMNDHDLYNSERVAVQVF